MNRLPRARNGCQSPHRIPRIPRLPRLPTPALQTRRGTRWLEHRCQRRSPAWPRHRSVDHRLTATRGPCFRPSLANCPVNYRCCLRNPVCRPAHRRCCRRNPVCRPAHRRCCRRNPVCRPANHRCCRANLGGCPASRRGCPGHRWAPAASPVRTARPAGCSAVRPVGHRAARPTARIPDRSMKASPTIRTARTNCPTAGRNHSPTGRHCHQAAPATGCSSRTHLRSASAATGKATRCRPGSGSGRDCHSRGTKAMTMATTSPAAAASRARTSNSSSCSRQEPGHRPPATQGAG